MNSYLPVEQIYLICNELGNLNEILTKDILENVNFLYIKVEEGNRGGIIIDNSKRQSTDIVKYIFKASKVVMRMIVMMIDIT